MKIIKIPKDNQKQGTMKSGDKYRVIYPEDDQGKEKRRFAIKKLKIITNK